MRPITRLLIGCSGILLWCLGILHGGGTLDPQSGNRNDRSRIPVGEPFGPPRPPPVYETRQPRQVDAGLFASPLARPEEPLERIGAREALSPMAAAPERPPHFARPGTVLAGALAFGSRSITLKGVVPTAPGRICPGSAGPWPCGMVARTQQRLFIRNRAVACDIVEKTWVGTAIASCSIGETDIAAWLVGNGWAEAEPGTPLTRLMEEAKVLRRGLFGDDPR